MPLTAEYWAARYQQIRAQLEQQGWDDVDRNWGVAARWAQRRLGEATKE